MKTFNSVLAMTLALGLALSACNRRPQVTSADETTKAFGQSDYEDNPNVGPAADNLSASIDAQRAPTSQQPVSKNSQTNQRQTIPHDQKGVVGSPFASNINRSSPGEPQVGEAHGVPAGNPAVQPKTVAGPPNFENGTQTTEAAGEKLNIDKYSYQQRSEFKAAVTQRLDAIDRALAKTKSAQIPRDQLRPSSAEQLNQIQKEHDQIASNLPKIDRVSPDQWNQTKVNFRDQVVSLERDFNSYVSAQR